MKTILFILLANFIIANNLLSADRVKSASDNQALLFELDGLDKLGANNFSGGLGYKYFIAKDLAIRLSVGYSQFDETETKLDAGTSYSLAKTNNSLNVSPSILYTFAKNNTIAGYIGVGGFFKKSDNTSDYLANSKVFQTNEIVNSYGASLILGAEWFAWDNVSLSMEYNLRYSNASGDKKDNGNTIEPELKLPTTTNLELGTSSYKFVLSFYIN